MTSPQVVPPARERSILPGCLGWSLVLFLLSVPLWSGGSRHAPGFQYRQAVRTISGALEKYARDHGGRFPAVRPLSPAGEDTDTDTSPASGLTAALAGQEPEGRENILEKYQKAEPVWDTPAGWKNGLVFAPDFYAIYDPYGRCFRARMDTNGDGCVANPMPTRAPRGEMRLLRSVIVWGAGKDGDWDTWEDNVISWENTPPLPGGSRP